jgi:hypothetical protein
MPPDRREQPRTLQPRLSAKAKPIIASAASNSDDGSGTAFGPAVKFASNPEPNSAVPTLSVIVPESLSEMLDAGSDSSFANSVTVEHGRAVNHLSHQSWSDIIRDKRTAGGL